MLQHINVTTANVNKVPPSFLTSIPSANIWEKIAPIIVPKPKIAPIIVVRGIKINIDAINSNIQEPIVP